jgi:hypothetical protein
MYNAGCFCMDYEKEEFWLPLFYCIFRLSLSARFDDACENGRGTDAKMMFLSEGSSRSCSSYCKTLTLFLFSEIRKLCCYILFYFVILMTAHCSKRQSSPSVDPPLDLPQVAGDRRQERKETGERGILRKWKERTGGGL